jgi:CheY-like chemotaxis protein
MNTVRKTLLTSSASAPSVDRARRRVALVVDADSDVRELYRRLLAPAGYDVREATDGREGLARVYIDRPDVLIADAQLPFIAGDELCELLRRDPQTARLPLLLVTATRLVDSPRASDGVAADAVLVKPFPPEALVQHVTALDRRRAAVPAANVLGPRRADGDAGHATVGRLRKHFVTRQPPLTPPALRCPSCDTPLRYDRSHIGGVGARGREQWDEFVCPRCGIFQYRHRTRTLRPI